MVAVAEKHDLTDGMRLNRDDSWVLVRASGTEPLVRVTVEARREGEARDLLEEIQDALRACSSEQPLRHPG